MVNLFKASQKNQEAIEKMKKSSGNYFAKSKKNKQMNIKENGKSKSNGFQNGESKQNNETKKKEHKITGKSPTPTKYTGTIKKKVPTEKPKKEKHDEEVHRGLKRKADEIQKTPKKLKIEKKIRMKDLAEALSDAEKVKKPKTKVKVSSDSDSENEDYIDKFFSSDEEDLTASGDIEESSDCTASGSEMGDSNYGEEPTNKVPLKKLIDYFGQRKDKEKKVPTPKPKPKLEWIEEDNLDEVGRKNETKTVARIPSPKKKVKEITRNMAIENCERESSSSSELSVDSWSTMTEEDEDGETDELTDYSIYSGSDDENMSVDDEEDISSSDGLFDDSYDSDDDTDYLPDFLNDNETMEENDDLYIGRGQAKIYEIDDNHVSFNSDYDGAQIVEILPETQSEKEEECPALVVAGSEKQEESSKSPESELPMSRNLEELFNDPSASSTDLEEEISISDIDKTNFKFYNAVDLRISLLVMKEDTLFVNGHLIVQVLVGHLEIMGYSLRKNETKSIYAARGFQYLNLTAKPDKKFQKVQLEPIFDKLKMHFRAADLSAIQSDFDPTVDVLVMLQSDASNDRINSVQRFMNDLNVFPNLNSLKITEFSRAEQHLRSQFYTKHSKCLPIFKKNEKWDTVNVKKDSKIIVAGGKGVGKSTICQYLINKNVSKFKKILLIDLDIGQPIFGVPETISATLVDGPILGLGCFDRYTPVKSFLFGNLDVVTSPIKYIHAVKKLLDFCLKMDQLKDIPWVVNTMGYVTGFGEELLSAIFKFLSPTDIIQISTGKQYFKNLFTSSFVNKYTFNILREEVQSHMKVTCKFETHQMEADFQKERKRGYLSTPAMRRDLNILSHLVDVLKGNALWFTDVMPYKLKLAEIDVLITREDDKPPNEMLADVLNANLVFLCKKGVDNMEIEFYGLGIVRAVDREGNIALITPLSSSVMKNVNCLAVCSSTLPKSILHGQNPKILENISYLCNGN